MLQEVVGPANWQDRYEVLGGETICYLSIALLNQTTTAESPCFRPIRLYLRSMQISQIKAIYRNYIECLNARDWNNLGKYVADNVTHNGNPLGLSGYRKKLETDIGEIPDLQYNAVAVICEPPGLAARLKFDCYPTREFMGLRIDGKHVVFHENVFYEFESDKIVRVRSIVDKAEIEAAL
jgi:predicted ester cyclase